MSIPITDPATYQAYWDRIMFPVAICAGVIVLLLSIAIIELREIRRTLKAMLWKPPQ